MPGLGGRSEGGLNKSWRHSRKKAGSRDPGSHDFFGKNYEKYFVGKVSENFGKIRKKSEKY